MTKQVIRNVAVIIDGNGRWARRRGISITEGHRAGARVLTDRVLDALEFKLEQLAVYTFSTENWSRPIKEVAALLRTVEQHIAARTVELSEREIRIRFIGRRSGLPRELVARMEWAEAITARNHSMTVFIAVNYGGRAEIIDAAQNFAGRTEDDFRACLYAPDMNDVDVVIRTGGEKRISNCLLWQTAYAELVLIDELWPDFSRSMFERALNAAAGRTRTFGGRYP